MKCPHCDLEIERPLSAKTVDLNVQLKRPKRGWPAANFTALWADGSETFVSGVIFEKPALKWAAAFQAANRLRRYRAARQSRFGLTARGELPPGAQVKGADAAFDGSGIWQDSYAWTAWIYVEPMPALVRLTTEDGETWNAKGAEYGAGDPLEAALLWNRM